MLRTISILKKGDPMILSCPSPVIEDTLITLSHGSGGRWASKLIEEVFLKAFCSLQKNERHDGALIHTPEGPLVFTTDSYVVQPIFFPGGDIGSLSITGTVNDLVMCGARPAFISCGFIIEEGVLQSDLKKIVASMQRCAIENNLQIVTGDTKVIERHEGKNIFINTSGIGIPMTKQKIRPSSITPGDAIILTGDIGRHGMAVMAQREGLRFSLPLLSDCASLLPAIEALLSAGTTIHCMRDLTRGGLATALVELAQDSGMNFLIDEEKIPISDGVSASCEILGLDPLYVANEGRCIAFIPQNDVQQALDVLSTFAICTDACVMGQVIEQSQEGSVVIENGYGTRRFLFQLSSEQLPRIC